jgi:hypothetical protein
MLFRLNYGSKIMKHIIFNFLFFFAASALHSDLSSPIPPPENSPEPPSLEPTAVNLPTEAIAIPPPTETELLTETILLTDPLSPIAPPAESIEPSPPTIAPDHPQEAPPESPPVENNLPASPITAPEPQKEDPQEEKPPQETPQQQTTPQPTASDAVQFTPPKGWRFADSQALSNNVLLMVIGKGQHAFPPSMHLGTERYEGTLKEYLKIVRAINDAKGDEWKDLGTIRTAAGDASLSQLDTKTEWGDVRMLHVILIKEGTVYILTAAALKEEFPKFYKDFFRSLRSLRVNKDLLKSE